MRHIIRPILACLLAVLIAATGLTAASARGQTRINGVVILCSGAIYQPEGEDGAPHICPDMALSLMVALAATPILAPAPDSLSRMPFTQLTRLNAPQTLPQRAARDPPATV